MIGSPPPASPAGDDPVYDTIARFAAELVRRGVGEVVISPGSRSTPLTLTLDAQPGLRTWIQIDERSAAFFALGLGRATGRPAVLVCTSGTAAANHLPAVVEAHHAGVPLIVCTADRPPELRDWGSPQTIDQVGLFGTATRWAVDLPVPGTWPGRQPEMVAKRAVAAAAGPDPGPVHLNWPLREPLEPVGAVPVTEAAPGPVPVPPGATPAAPAGALSELLSCERGVIVVGPLPGVGFEAEHRLADEILELAAATAWPVLAEPITQLRRRDPHASLVVSTAGSLLADRSFGSAMAAEVVVRIGHTPTTKAVRLWMQADPPTRVVALGAASRWTDASFTLTDHLAAPDLADVTAVAAGVGSTAGRSASVWLEDWRRADAVARATIAHLVDDGPLLSALVARTVVDALPEEAALMASSSMPVRDLDAYVEVGGPRVSITGNRGAAGIDGVVSAAVGLAATRADRSAVLLTGDLALLHDLGGLTAAARLGLHLTVVCVDNDGGGIFSMLPIADRAAEADFERLFRTPHGLDLVALDGFGGIRAHPVRTAAALAALVSDTSLAPEPGVDLAVVTVDGDADLAQRRSIEREVARAVTKGGP